MDKSTANQSEKIIMGIDPGTTIMGYGMIRVKGKKVEMLTMGVIHLSKLNNHALKLQRIFDRCVQLIDEFHPDEVAAEAPFFGQNVQSMLKLGRAQGVAFAAALSRQIPIVEYAPRKIKQSVTGNGNASKEQVAAMLCSILNINQADLPKELDATDGLAAAVCHHFQSGTIGASKSYSGWDAFVKGNEDRVSKRK
ncbi:MAG: crossover junction endodeoxyribonuclease RuvC [Flavobacteriales bacterium]|jgi:crossover junction endodeoxyribonuclease RuvC